MNNTQSASSIKFIVPVHLEALRVAPSCVEKAKTSVYDFSALGQHPTSGLGNLIAANRFQDAEMSLNQNPGVHLHWTLPRAYTHGVQNQKTGSVKFPMLPNRWLVIRYFKDNQKQTNNTRIRLWILESDAHSENSGEVGDSQTTIPWMDNAADLQGIEPNYIGKKIDFTGAWTEPGLGGGVSYLGSQFQAPYGYGETFTAYYQNCDNVLGLNDDFSDYFPYPNGLESNTNFTASYAVMGWVSSSADDECSIILNQGLREYNALPDKKPAFADFIQQVIEQRLEWSLDDYSSLTVANAGDIQAVMGGVLANLEWKITGPGDPTYPTAIPSADGVQVAIGNNTAQALSAYIDAIEKSTVNEGGNGVTSNLEWLLDALQFNQLHKLSAGDQGLGQLEEYLHGTNFASDPGGYLWTARLQMKPNQPQVPAADIEVALPVYLAKLLSELNERQKTLDDTRNEITSRRKQIFFDWTYHINSLDTQVIHGGSSYSEDDSGNFLMDGMLQLYPVLIKAGNFVETGSPAAPYQPKSDAFRILAPTSQIPNLPDYVFNSENNQTAGNFVQSLLAFGLGIDEVGDGDFPDAADRLAQALSFLRLFQAGGAQANDYLKMADEQVTESLAELKKAETKLGAVRNPGSGLTFFKTGVDDSQNTLSGYVDTTTGVFATALKYTADPGKAPLPAGEVYHGALQGSALAALGSWDAPVNTFPGMKAQLDIFSGQNGRPQQLFDIQEAALYLGLAYFYFKSGVPFKCSSAYYLQMSEQTIKDASSSAAKASSALEQAISALNGTVLSDMYDSLQQIISVDIPKIQADIKDADNPAIADAITQLESLLDSATEGGQSLPALQAVILSKDWQNLRSGIDTAILMTAGQMPLSQQVAGWNQFLYQQISDKYELRSAPRDHYFYPNEPVIILAERESKGDLLEDFVRNGKAPRAACRLDSNIVDSANAVTYPPEISNLASNLVTGIPGLSEVLEKLAKESYLLTPELSDVVSAADLKAAAENNKALHYNKVHDVELNAPPSGLTGKLPYYIAYNWRVNADRFLPLFIWWEADYQYSQKFDFTSETYPSDFLNQFELDKYEVDLQPAAGAMPSFNRNPGQPNFFSVHGLISLSSSSTSSLCGQIQIYCQTYLNYDPASGPPPPTLPDFEEAEKFYEAYQDYKTRNILSQGLSGFNPGLVQRAQELQLPVTVPRSWTNGPGKTIPLSKLWVTSFLHNESASYPTTWNDESINLDAQSVGSSKVYFNPFRAGFMGLTKISLVDAFGRFIALTNPNPEIIAESMKSSQIPPADHSVYLAPRLAQPSRLSFDWISAASHGGIKSFPEPNEATSASPVCGWIWANHLDDSLMLYDESGIPLGSLRTRGTVLHWFPVPGETTQVGIDNQSQMVKYLKEKNANPVFKDFLVQYLYSDTSSGTDQKFQNFLTVLSKSQQFVITASMQEDQALGVLMGRPLVITQASLSLEQKGLPFVGLDASTYPAWNQFGPQFDVGNSEYIPYNFDNFNQSGITNLKVPVRVGTAEVQKNGTRIPYFDDGLAGYFMPEKWETLYTPADVADTPGIVSVSAPGSHPLSLSPDGSAARLTLLMDPRAAIHATTGILPVQSAAIHSDQYENILNQLEITFLSTPLLAAQDPPVIPLPTEQGFDWFWVEIGKENVPLQPSQGNADAVFPQHPLHLVDGWLKLKKGS